MFRKIIFAFWSLTLFSIAAVAQTPVTIEQCREEALKNNNDIQMSSLKVQKAEASVKEAKTAYFPKIEGSGTAMYIPDLEELAALGIEKENIELYQAQASASIPIYAGGKIRNSNKMARTGAQMAQQAEVLEKSEVILQTDEAFWKLVTVQEQKKVIDNYLEALESLEDQLQARYELELLPKSELLKVTVQKNKAEINRLEVKNAVRILQMNLAQKIGFPLEEELLAKPGQHLQAQTENTSTNFQPVNLQSRPEINILNSEVEMAKLEKKNVTADFLPQIGAQVTYGYTEAPGIISGATSTMATANISIPIFHWGERKHKTTKAKIEQQTAEVNLKNTKELISLEIRKVWLKLQENIEKISLAENNLNQAKETFEEVKISYEAEINTITDLLNARAGQLEAEASLLEAKANYQISKTNWLKVSGQLAYE